MNRVRATVASVFLVGALCLATPVAALDCPHGDDPPCPGSSFGSQMCNSCHAVHNSDLADLLKDQACLSCHINGGPAPEVATHINVTDSGSAWFGRNADGLGNDFLCQDCHDPHAHESQLAENFIGFDDGAGNILRSTPVGSNQAIRYEGPAGSRQTFIEATGSAPHGICEVCHTRTAAFVRNGIGDTHYGAGASQPCIDCHEHTSGFEPTGCVICHSSPQGSRRAIVGPGGDFARPSHHVLTSVQNSDCVTCHAMGAHMLGTVVLRDPDQGDSVTYAFDPLDPSNLVGFCVNCHDADGAVAGGGTSPFSDGQLAPDISRSGAWAASAHAGGLSCYGDGTTTGCHGNGHGSNLAKLLQPFDGTVGPDNAEQEEGFCYGCHGAGGLVGNEAISNGWFGGVYENYADNIQAAMGLASSHPVNDLAPGHTFDIGFGPQELECTSCHSVHGASGKYWQAPAGVTPVSLFPSGELWGDDPAEKAGQFDLGQTYQAPFLGEAGVDLSGSPLPIGGGGDSLLVGSVLPDYSSFCLACHQQPLGSVTAIAWGSAKHGSIAAEPLGLAGWPLNLPYDDANRGSYQVQCVDCHEAHGSQNVWMLRTAANGTTVASTLTSATTVDFRDLCDRCHEDVSSARHHNDDVVAKLGITLSDCMDCHNGMAMYTSCIASGCHAHNDWF